MPALGTRLERFASVLAMMKVGGVGNHAFGEAAWWGRELFGIDNALVKRWGDAA